MFSRIASELSYYLASVYYNTKSFFVYRAQAWLWILESVLSLLFNLVAVAVIYTVSSGIPGWSYYQLLFLTYLMYLTYGIAVFLANPWQFPYNLRMGQLDSLLTRPFGYLTTAFSNARAISPLIGSVIGSIAFLAYLSLHMHFSLLLILAFIPLYVLGVAAFVLFLQFLAAASYKFMKSGTFINQAMNALGTLTNFPLSVYGGIAQMFFTLLVPIGVAGYYPVQVLLGGVTPEWYVVLIVLSVVFIFVFYRLFNVLMRSYESGGG
jgi:ABC-type uncharacterized transport system permease subunit